jgi:Mce-associated membrane protein
VTASPTWYDVLGVDPAATPEEIRTAWRSAIADLEPGDRRFRSCNQAAEVLLDPARRAEYDAGLAIAPPAPAPPEAVGDEPGVQPEDHAASTAYEPPPTHQRTGSTRPEGRRSVRSRLAGLRRPARPGATSTGEGATTGRQVPTWLLAGLAVLVVAAVAVTAWVWNRESAAAVAESTRAAQTAAEQAVVPILSYDHKTIEQDQQRAHGYLTEDYRKDYDQLIEVIAQNAPRTRTVVEAEVVSSGIVRSGEDRVQVLVFVDRPTTNKLSREPVVYKDQVTLTMEKVGDDWLVDEMVTTPPQQSAAQ